MKPSLRPLTLLLLLPLAAAMALTSCRKDSPRDGKLQDVVITATIELPIPGLRTGTNTGGEVIWDDTTHMPQEEGSANERYVGYLRLIIAEDTDEAPVVINELFRDPNNSALTEGTPFEHFTDNKDGMQKYRMKVKIKPGTYRVYLVANEIRTNHPLFTAPNEDEGLPQAGYDQLMRLDVMQSAKTSIENNRKYFTNYCQTPELLATAVEKGSGLYMLSAPTEPNFGYSVTQNYKKVIIEPNRNTTDTEIPLWRRVAKVEFNLRNTNPQGEVYATAEPWQILAIDAFYIGASYLQSGSNYMVSQTDVTNLAMHNEAKDMTNYPRFPYKTSGLSYTGTSSGVVTIPNLTIGNAAITNADLLYNAKAFLSNFLLHDLTLSPTELAGSYRDSVYTMYPNPGHNYSTSVEPFNQTFSFYATPTAITTKYYGGNLNQLKATDPITGQEVVVLQGYTGRPTPFLCVRVVNINTNERRAYVIPLWGTAQDKFLFNYLYRINAVLEGPNLYVTGMAVLPWKTNTTSITADPYGVDEGTSVG